MMVKLNSEWAHVGSLCPSFLARHANGAAGEHIVVIEDEAIEEDGGTYITMMRDDDGGLLLYDDSECACTPEYSTVRRVVEDPETLTEAFKDAVGETVRHYYHLDSYGEDLRVEYTGGDEPVEFDIGRDVEVHRR